MVGSCCEPKHKAQTFCQDRARAGLGPEKWEELAAPVPLLYLCLRNSLAVATGCPRSFCSDLLWRDVLGQDVPEVFSSVGCHSHLSVRASPLFTLSLNISKPY